MKTSNIIPGQPNAAVAGRVSAVRAASTGITVSDVDGGEVTPAQEVQFSGATVSGLGDNTALVSITGTGDNLVVSGSANVSYGDVVVLASDGTVTTTTTPQDTRPVGVVQLGGNVGDTVSVIFSGFVAQVNCVASVAAGNYGETSTTAGKATQNASVRTGSFCQFLATSASPSAYLFSATTSVGTNAELNIEGGQSVIKAHGSMGSTETLDPTDGNVHTGTLDANCAFTLNAPTGTGAATLELYLTQDGTGSRTVTWPGSVIWPGGVAPTLSTAAAAVDRIILETVDGGTNWYGLKAGSGVSSVALTVPAEFSVSGSPVTSAGTLAITKTTETANTVWAGPTSGSAAQPVFRALVAADMPSGVGTTDHEHIGNVQFNGDGATMAFELPAAPFNAYSVIASVAGVIQDVTLSGAMLTTMTFASAPGAGTGNVRADIVAAVS